MEQIRIVNVTGLFNKDIFIYSLGKGFSLSKPISLVTSVYVLFFLTTWTLPATLIFGFQIFTSPYTFALAVLPPITLGITANKPIWGGRNLLSWIEVNIKYLLSAKSYADHKAKTPSNKKNEHTLTMSPWVSRRSDYRRALKNNGK